MADVMMYVNRKDLLQCLSVTHSILALLFCNIVEKNNLSDEEIKGYLAMAGSEIATFLKDNNMGIEDILDSARSTFTKMLGDMSESGTTGM